MSAATTATCNTGWTACSCPKACRCSTTPCRPSTPRNLSLITGALPAQYGFRTAGIVDIALKSGTSDPGAEATMTAGSRNFLQPAFSYGGRSGAIDYFATGQFLHNGVGIENPTPSDTPIHDDTDQWHALAKVTGIVDEQTRVSLIAGGSRARFQIPNNPGQTPSFTVAGASDLNSALLDQRQWGEHLFRHGIAAEAQRGGRLPALGFRPLFQPGLLQARPVRRSDVQRHRAMGTPAPASPPGCRATAAGRSAAATPCAAVSWHSASTPPAAPIFASPADRRHRHADQLPAVGIVQGADNVGWLYGVYVQDEWTVTPTVTVNYGLRFDVADLITQKTSSARAQCGVATNDILTAHVGYSRYFTTARRSPRSTTARSSRPSAPRQRRPPP
jgi:outer membrane receptor protein involved in Fe transport